MGLSRQTLPEFKPSVYDKVQPIQDSLSYRLMQARSSNVSEESYTGSTGKKMSYYPVADSVKKLKLNPKIAKKAKKTLLGD